MTATYAYASPEAVGEPASVTVTGPDAGGVPTSTVTRYRYDSRGNRTASIDALGYETDYYYTLADQLQAVVSPSSVGSASQRVVTYTTYQYPGGPQSSTQVFAEGAVTSFPALGSVFPAPTASAFRQTSNVYDADGELMTVNGNTYPVLNAYDGRGRVKSVTYYQSSLMDSHTTFYDYDVVGNLAAVRYPGQSGATFDQTHYTYDADGNVATEISGAGVTKTYARVDPESLLTGISYGYPSGYAGTTTSNVKFTYDHWGRRIGAAQHDPTNPDPSADASKTYTYDDLNELQQVTSNFGHNPYDTSVGPQGQQVAYSHYPNGSRAQMTLPATNYGSTQAFQYDGVGRLSATYLAGEGWGFRYGYLPNGWLAQTQGISFPVGVTSPGQASPSQVLPFLQVDRAYNPRGFLTGLTNSQITNPAQPTQLTRLSAFSGMTYDAGGNRLGETASVPARGQAPDLSRSVTYQYDTLDQLTAETSTGSAAGTTYTEIFGYDLAGNPTSTSGRRATTGATFNADNQATRTGYTGTGDPLGLYLFANTTASSATFDPEDRLASIPSYAFYTSYDGDGLRTVEGYSYTYYLYDGDQSVAEVASDQYGQPTLSAYNGYGASGLEWRSGSGSSYSAYTYDPQGSVVEPVTLYYNGGPPVIKVRSSSLYDGFGLGVTATAEGSAGTDPYDSVGFGGQHGYYRDYTTGLYLLGHRYYDARAGRFVTRDPIGYKGGINLYGFAGNNPVNESDPSGFSPPGSYEEFFNAWNNFSLSDAIQETRQSIRNNFNLRLAVGAAKEIYSIYDHTNQYVMGQLQDVALSNVSETVPTGPRLPAPLIYRRGNVRIVHKYGGGLDAMPGGRSDHLPAHAHVEGGGPETHIGANGKPIDGWPELTKTQQEAVDAGRSIIRTRINKINKWAKYMKYLRKVPKVPL